MTMTCFKVTKHCTGYDGPFCRSF